MRWPPEVIESFWKVCCAVTDLRQAKLLEAKLRKGTGTEYLLEINTCHCSGPKGDDCGGAAHHHKDGDAGRSSLAPYCFRKSPDDELGDLLQRYTHRTIFIRDYLAEVAEVAADTFNKVVKRAGITQLERSEKASLSRTCLENAISRVISQAILKDRSRSRQHTQRDGGLVAYATSYPKMYPDSPFVELASLKAEHMGTIMNNGVAVIPNWLSPSDANDLRKNLDWLEMNNVYDDMTPFSPDPYRTDHAVWINGAEVVEEARIPAVRLLLQKFASLPFELNAKANLSLTISNTALFGLFKKDAYFRKHIDNTSDPKGDNGRTVTFMYFVRPDAPDFECEERQVDLTFTSEKGGNEVSIEPPDNGALVFLTRDRSVAIESVKSKTFVVSYWCGGMAVGGR